MCTLVLIYVSPSHACMHGEGVQLHSYMYIHVLHLDTWPIHIIQYTEHTAWMVDKIHVHTQLHIDFYIWFALCHWEAGTVTLVLTHPGIEFAKQLENADDHTLSLVLLSTHVDHISLELPSMYCASKVKNSGCLQLNMITTIKDHMKKVCCIYEAICRVMWLVYSTSLHIIL